MSLLYAVTAFADEDTKIRVGTPDAGTWPFYINLSDGPGGGIIDLHMTTDAANNLCDQLNAVLDKANVAAVLLES